MKKIGKKAILILAAVIIAAVYYYVTIPAINIHSSGLNQTKYLLFSLLLLP